METNQKTYNSKHVVQWYDKLHAILPVEEMIFEGCKTQVNEGHVLDIGIGGGRTTAYLINKCKHYTGIDYSENFIRLIKKKYPECTCFVMDARNLSSFKSGQFDLVNFSLNGIDYVDLKGREKILSEIKRVLKPHGLFFFSTHNKLHPDFNTDPWLSKNNSVFVNIKTFLKLFPFLRNKRKYKKMQLIREEYAIVNDSAHNYSLMTFYTSPQFLRQQLSDKGFGNINFFARSGEKKTDTELEEWIFASAKNI